MWVVELRMDGGCRGVVCTGWREGGTEEVQFVRGRGELQLEREGYACGDGDAESGGGLVVVVGCRFVGVWCGE